MALINGNDYDHIDFTKNGVTTRHMLKDTLSRQMSGDLVKVQNEEPTSEGTKIWIKPSGDSEVQVPTYEEFEELSEKIDDADATIESLAVGDHPTVSVTEVDGHKRFSFGIPASNGIASITKTATDGVIDTYTIAMTDGTSTSFSVNNSDITPESMVEAITTALQDYARIDGYYSDMTVGNAEQLNSSKYVENSEPYTFRTSGGSADIGNREYLDAVVGGTVAWNQLLKQQIDGTSNPFKYTVSDDIVTVEMVNESTKNFEVAGLSQATQQSAVHKDHKYLVVARIYEYSKQGSVFGYLYGFPNSDPPTYSFVLFGTIASSGVYAKVLNCPADLSATRQLRVGFWGDNWTVGDKLKGNAVLFDLTQMFGTTIADYIYNLEQATAGAGLALFRSWFPNDYYEYNPGELLSVEGLQSHDMAGFNLWDEKWENGIYNNQTGEPVVSTSNIRSKNAIRVFPNTQYFMNVPYSSTVSGFIAVLYYDANDSYTGNVSSLRSNGQGFLTPSNACYMRFYVSASYGTTYKHDICINLFHSGARNGEYEPYVKHSYPLDSSVVLRGIPKVGANGVYWDGDRYLPDGTVERRYGVVDMGTITWVYNSGRKMFSSGTIRSAPIKSAGSAVTALHGTTNINAMFNDASLDKVVCCGQTGSWNGEILVRDLAYDGDAAAFKAAMSGVLLVYELATPTTETAQPYHSTQWVSDWGTEEFVSTGIVPVGSETRYPANLRDKLQHLPDAASGNGSYLITQTDGQMVLTPFPAPPSTAGNYVLKATVVNGVATYTWEVAT